MIITSTANQQMKNVMQLHKKAKTRYEQRVFVVEGPKMCLEAPIDWVQQMYVAESFLEDQQSRERLSGYDYQVVSDGVLKAVSDTKTPQGILCTVQMPEYTLADILNRGTQHLLLLEGIQDPGNLGTMLRTGEGADITGVIMDKQTVDIFHPKVIRATMGSIFRVPFLVVEDLWDTAVRLKEAGVLLYAAHLKGTRYYDLPNYQGGTGFLIGNEGKGLCAKTAQLADDYVKIPMAGQVESLNAAIAATLLMYEVNRQRR